MVMIYIRTPIAPSINQMYWNRKHGASGRGRVLTDEARNFKEEVGWLVRAELTEELPKKSKFGLIILLHTKNSRRDVSNVLKITEDAVFEAAGISDSRDTTIMVRKIPDTEDFCEVYFGLEDDIKEMIVVLLDLAGEQIAVD